MSFSFKKVVGRTSFFQRRIEALEKQLSITTKCLEQISKGDMEFEVSAHLSHDDDSQSFVATLHQVQKRLSQYAQQERERNWTTDGMAQFMELIKGEKKADFYDRILAFLVKYTHANQGGVFLLNNQNPDDLYLELVSCYAYNKKRITERRIEIGQGMLGQCFLEKSTLSSIEVPNFYTTITSGLGEATPHLLLMVPLKYDNQILGIIEMAYFVRLKPFQIEFIEKIAENMATATLNMHHAKQAEALFRESQEKAQILQEKEEALRQNVEELVGTQEEMKRNQAELNRQSQFLKFVLDNIPFPVFVKDEKGRYIHVNQAEAKLLNLDDHVIIGKDDKYFVSSEQEWKLIRESDEKALASSTPVELPIQHFTTVAGAAYIFNTTKVSFVNEVTGQKNILGVSIDVTEKLKLEQEWMREKNLNRHNNFINVAGRQRMLSQKIAFYAEKLLRVKTEPSHILRSAIELYEHSLYVIRFGGIPIDMHCDVPLDPLHPELLPCLEEIEKLWIIYKQAAENILYFSSSQQTPGKELNDTEENILTIENKAEVLLNLNNNLIQAYLQAHSQKHHQLMSFL